MSKASQNATPNRWATRPKPMFAARADVSRKRQYVVQCIPFGLSGNGSARLVLPPRKLVCLPSKPGRLEPNGWLKSRPIWTLLVTMTLIAGCANINAPADGCGWVKPISVAEEDRLTTATKRALLAHNEAWTEYCK